LSVDPRDTLAGRDVARAILTALRGHVRAALVLGLLLLVAEEPTAVWALKLP
jgi:hypothetical protein